MVAIPCGDGRLIVIASNYGQRKNPAWYHNLRKHPTVRVLFDGEEQQMIARELDGAERADWYERGIEIYGGGQAELGVGRGQIQYLASIFHPDGVNDIAPAGYDWAEFPTGLPASPLAPDHEPTGFRRRT